MDNDNNESTIIRFTTPADYSFKESEIPITITYEGKSEGDKGFTLMRLVKRYLLHVHIWGE